MNDVPDSILIKFKPMQKGGVCGFGSEIDALFVSPDIASVLPTLLRQIADGLERTGSYEHVAEMLLDGNKKDIQGFSRTDEP